MKETTNKDAAQSGLTAEVVALCEKVKALWTVAKPPKQTKDMYAK